MHVRCVLVRRSTHIWHMHAWTGSGIDIRPDRYRLSWGTVHDTRYRAIDLLAHVMIIISAYSASSSMILTSRFRLTWYRRCITIESSKFSWLEQGKSLGSQRRGTESTFYVNEENRADLQKTHLAINRR